MAGTVVRKEALAALIADDGQARPPDLNGWDTDDVEAVMGQVVKGFRRTRLAIGYLLWKHRALNVDAVYGAYAAKVAQDCDVDVRTLQRWRVFAETKYALPPPDRRTEATRAAMQRPKPVEVAPPDAEGGDTMSPPKLRTHESQDGPAPAPIKPDAVTAPALPDPEPPQAKPVQQTLPGAEAWGVVRQLSIMELAKFDYSELKELQRKVSEALRYAPRLRPATGNPKRSPASTSDREVTTFFKGGKK